MPRLLLPHAPPLLLEVLPLLGLLGLGLTRILTLTPTLTLRLEVLRLLGFGFGSGSGSYLLVRRVCGLACQPLQRRVVGRLRVLRPRTRAATTIKPRRARGEGRVRGAMARVSWALALVCV